MTNRRVDRELQHLPRGVQEDLRDNVLLVATRKVRGWTRKITVFIVLGYTILSLAFVYVVLRFSYENRVDEYEKCLSDVELRDETREVFNAIFDIFPQDSEEVIAAREVIDTKRPALDSSSCVKPDFWSWGED